MILLKSLKSRKNVVSRHYTSWGLFLCPYCEKMQERRLNSGKKSETCGCNLHKLYPQHSNEILEGLILTDGFVGGRNNRFQFGTTSYIYAVAVKEFLEREYNVGNVRLYTAKNRKDGIYFTAYNVTWHNRKFLGPFRYKWYPQGEKRIPDDFTITPKLLNIAYIADGCASGGEAVFYLGLIENIEKFRAELFNLGIETSLLFYSSCQRVKILRASTKRFLEYIGNPLISSYQYKWDKLIIPKKERGYRIGR